MRWPATRFFALITNFAAIFGSAVDIERHHRLRGGAPEEAIRQLKWDLGMNRAPVQNLFANWVWWLASALGDNVCVLLRSGVRPGQGTFCHLSRQATAGERCNVAAPWCACRVGCACGSREPVARRSVHRRSSRATGVADFRMMTPEHRVARPESRRNYAPVHLSSPLPTLRVPLDDILRVSALRPAVSAQLAGPDRYSIGATSCPGAMSRSDCHVVFAVDRTLVPSGVFPIA